MSASTTNMLLIFFVYGLAFFAMGLAIALESRRASELELQRSLGYLAAFGLTHASVEWIDMVLLLPPPWAAETIALLRITRTGLLVLSTLLLAQFAVTLIRLLSPRYGWVQWLPPLLAAFWLINWAVVPHLPVLPGGVPAIRPGLQGDSCLRCHTATAPAVTIPPTGWPPAAIADVWARYLLYFPGSVLAAVALWRQTRQFHQMGLPHIARDSQWASFAFAFNAVVAGLIVPPAPVFPASVLNYNTFLSVVGVPPHLFRALSAVAIAYFIVRTLRVFEIEYRRRLQESNEERFRAQQEALQLARRAQEEVEAQVRVRTQELFQRYRELAAIHAIATTLSRSLELEGILKATLDQLGTIFPVEASGIFLFDGKAGEPLEVCSGAHPDLLRGIGRLERGKPLSGEIVLEGATRAFIKVPLEAKGETLGEMILLAREGHRFSPQDLDLLTSVASQVGVAITNAMLFAETQRRRQEAEALYAVGMEISRLSKIEEILKLVAEKARELLEADAALVSLVEPATEEIVVRAWSGLQVGALAGVRLKTGQGLSGRVVATGQVVMTEDYLVDPSLTHELDPLVREEGLRAHLSVPITAGERVLGALTVARRTTRRFHEEDVALLARIAYHAAIAIENARLYEQVQSLAILEERDRIAREMHDGLGQVLGYLNLKTKVLEDLLTSGRNEEVREELIQMRRAIQDAYADVRQSILSLRTPSTYPQGIVSAVEEFLERFQQQTGVEVSLEVSGEKVTVPPTTGTQILRIVQEALTNVRKHAGCDRARVRIEGLQGSVRITVEDEGVGFDVSAALAERGHYGLVTMRERAESVGGKLEIVSAPGKGTKVIVTVPRGE